MPGAQLAFFSDVHADWPSLRDALAAIDRLDCELIVCGGDVVDGEPFPEETIALLRERRSPTIRDRRFSAARSPANTWALTFNAVLAA